MKHTAEIAIPSAAPNTFHYAVPEHLQGVLRVGHLVNVGFRSGRQLGIVMRLGGESPVAQLKPINALLHPEPLLSETAVALALRLSAEYLTPIGLCAWLWVPAGVVNALDERLTLLDRGYAPQNVTERALHALLARRGALRPAQINAALKDERWRATADALAEAGVIAIESILTPPSIRPPKVQTAALAFHPSALGDALAIIAFNGGRRADIHASIVRVLSRETEPVDVSWIYAQTDCKLSDLQKLAAMDFVVLGEKRSWRDALYERDYVPPSPPDLTDGQIPVWDALSRGIASDSYAPFVLQGVTGSGKTELYLRAIGAALEQGRTALYLVPEIALTEQTIRRVRARFPGRAAILHSRLTDAERYRVWDAARRGEIDIIVGARSAIFAPLPRLGVLIVDDEHDTSYKAMNAPVYDTRKLAMWRGEAEGAAVILGSATPDVSTLYRAERGELTRLKLPDRVVAHRMRIATQAERLGVEPEFDITDDETLERRLPSVTLVDMRAELHAGNTSIFSAALAEALTETLAKRQQAILFLNRRGMATYVFCRDCGYVARCPKCDQPLTYHEMGSQLVCHACGDSTPSPELCPQCGSRRIRFFGAGTQNVEAEVQKRFPSARVLRWDSDIAHTPEMGDALLSRFLDHQADILVGTELVTKGLDLPLVTLVGVISADTALNLPDFHAAERGFQVLSQAIARAGRGLLPGRVIVQSHMPEHPAVAAACAHDVDGFATYELAQRQALGYPPYRRLARIEFQHTNAARARDLAVQAAKALRHRIQDLGYTGSDLIGPAPCFHGRLNNTFRWQVLVRSPDPHSLLREVAAAQGWHVELDPVDVL